MNWKKTLALTAAALAALALGFFLPDLAGAIGRRALSKGSERVSAENMALYFGEMSFAEKLETAITGDTEIVMDTGTWLSQEEALAYARNFLLFFQKSGMSNLDFTSETLSLSAQALCTVSYASTESFVQWRIVAQDEAQDLEMYLLLDDESDVPLAFAHLPQSQSHTEFSIREIAMSWGMLYAEFTGLEYMDVYPSDTRTLIESASDGKETADPYRDVSDWEQWQIEFRQQDGETVFVSFFCLDGYYYFNAF